MKNFITYLLLSIYRKDERSKMKTSLVRLNGNK